MREVAKIEGRIRYSAFKKTIKVMITTTDSLDDLKAQVNTYFEHIGETQYTRHLFAQMPCIDHLGLFGTIATSDLCFRIWWKIIYYICMFVPSTTV